MSSDTASQAFPYAQVTWELPLQKQWAGPEAGHLRPRSVLLHMHLWQGHWREALRSCSRDYRPDRTTPSDLHEYLLQAALDAVRRAPLPSCSTVQESYPQGPPNTGPGFSLLFSQSMRFLP